ncbi:hypothetical protein KR018_009158 [Drosophila ironensis]|nr:hypothetical protein KR018_009158 [Drosophila ironensis]
MSPRCLLQFLGLCLVIGQGLRCDARAVNVSNTWTMPQEGLNVFYRFFRDRISWFEADAVCQFHHANLVTVDNSFQFDATRDLLRELDVNDIVWIGLMRPQNSDRFMWSNSRPLVADTGYWAESLPLMDAPLCAVIDPIRDYRWHALRCGGPETASFLCEMPVPSWADACILKDMPNLTMQYMADTASIELIRNCQEEGLLRQTCKGKDDRERAIRKLICPKERLEAQRITDITNSHFKSLQIIKNIRTDNNENNDIDLLPNYGVRSGMAINIEVSPPGELMQADAPGTVSLSGLYRIPDQVPKPVKKAAKKVIAADFAKKLQSHQIHQQQQQQQKTRKSLVHQQKEAKDEEDEMMMGDQPALSEEQMPPDVPQHQHQHQHLHDEEDDSNSEASNEIFEHLPHRKKTLPQDLRTMPPIAELPTAAPTTTTKSTTVKPTTAKAATATTTTSTTTPAPTEPATLIITTPKALVDTTSSQAPATTTTQLTKTTSTTKAPATTTTAKATTTVKPEEKPTTTKAEAEETTPVVTTVKPEEKSFTKSEEKPMTTEKPEEKTTKPEVSTTTTTTTTTTVKPEMKTTKAVKVEPSTITTSTVKPEPSTTTAKVVETSSIGTTTITTTTAAATTTTTTTTTTSAPISGSVGHPIHPGQQSPQQQQHEQLQHATHVKESADNSHFIPPMLLVKSHYVPPSKHEHSMQEHKGQHAAPTTTTTTTTTTASPVTTTTSQEQKAKPSAAMPAGGLTAATSTSERPTATSTSTSIAAAATATATTPSTVTAATPLPVETVTTVNEATTGVKMAEDTSAQPATPATPAPATLVIASEKPAATEATSAPAAAAAATTKANEIKSNATTVAPEVEATVAATQTVAEGKMQEKQEKKEKQDKPDKIEGEGSTEEEDEGGHGETATARHNFLEETEAPFKPNRRRSLTKPETVSYFKKILG